MTYRDDGINADLAEISDHLAERDRLGADRHAPEVSVEIDAGDDLARAGAQRRADLLPIVAVAPLDGVASRRDQLAVRIGELGDTRMFHRDSSFRPSRISLAVSAPSPASRAAAAMAAAAWG
jgi:hypothetical protein